MTLKNEEKCQLLDFFHETLNSFDKQHNINLYISVKLSDVSFKLGYLLGP